MLFNSLAFLIFLPLVFLVYWKVLQGRLKVQNIFILMASYLFYGWWDWRFLILIFISSIVDFLVAPKIESATNRKSKRLWLGLSLFVNLGMLGFFKYYNFFVDSFIEAYSWTGLHMNKASLNIILPVGISFYTFQTLSYSIDVYREKIRSTRDLVSFFAFVSFFPQLVAGPIERASHLLPQFQKNRVFDVQYIISGFRIMLWGFFKKIVIADNLAPIVDAVYQDPGQFSGLQIWLATTLFAIQVYGDFSGYSDIAIGCGRLLGFDLMTNFKTPYFSRSYHELWNRWHISLNTWFRDYLYFPLGGNRVSRPRWALNIMLVFTISGFWHGASWTFVFWGAMCGSFLLFAHFTEDISKKLTSGLRISEDGWLKKSYDKLAVFFLFTYTLIFFRANNSSDLFVLLRSALLDTWSEFLHMSAYLPGLAKVFASQRQMFILLLSVLVLFLIDAALRQRDFGDFLRGKSGLIRWSVYLGVLAWIFVFGAFARPENFVYFQF